MDAYVRLATNVALEFGADVNTAEQQIRDAVAFETTLANVRYKLHLHMYWETNKHVHVLVNVKTKQLVVKTISVCLY